MGKQFIIIVYFTDMVFIDENVNFIMIIGFVRVNLLEAGRATLQRL